MSLVNNSANNFKDFLDAIKPYLNYQFYDLSGQGVEANNFSTDEKVIGTWIDGKPLYQKTINFGALPNATGKDVPHGIANIDNMVAVFGIATASNNNTSFSLPMVYESSASQYNVLLLADKTNVHASCTNDRSVFNKTYVTLRYTKTTDTAVSSGEKIVGQWIDGKPVYEKTIDCGALPNNSHTSIPSGIDNFKMLIDIKAIASNSSNDSVVAPSYYISGSNDDYSLSVKMSQSNIIIKTYATWEGQASYSHVYVTLRYTKTT